MNKQSSTDVTSTIQKQKISTVLFDLDGTLIDTAPDMAAALDILCDEEQQTRLPYDEIRDRFTELPSDKVLIVFCNAGSRSYEIQVFLDHVGFGNKMVLPGGFNVIKRMGADWLPA